MPHVLYCVTIEEAKRMDGKSQGKKKETVRGKEPKEPLESTEEMRQREKGETGQK